MMDLPAPFDGPLPAAPGNSPYRLKGLSYMKILEEANQQLPGGFAALRASLPDADLVRFFEQSFLVMSYYDALPVIPITVALSRARGVPYADSVRNRAEQRAAEDLHIYRSLLRVDSPDQAFASFLRLWPRYFDFGRLDPTSVGPGHWEMRFSDLPSLLIPWFISMSEGYICTALRAAGVAEPKVGIGEMPPLPSPPGLESTNFRLDVTW